MNYDLFTKTIVDMEAIIDLGVNMRYYGLVYNSPEYWKRMDQEFKSAERDFRDFIRDHRSRDEYGIDIRKNYSLHCKFCGYEYPDNFNGIADCCDEMINAQNVKIEYTK